MKMSDGREIEVFTAEEQNAAVIAKENAVRTEMLGSVSAKETELVGLKTELGKLKEKDTNFEALKQKTEKAEADLKAMKDASDIADKKRVEDSRAAVIMKLAGGNKILAEKITKEYGGFALPETTEAEILERAKKAFYVAAPSDAPKAIDSFISMTGGRGASPTGTQVDNEPPPETPEQADMRRKMGTSDADYKKYGAKAAALNKK